MLTYSENVKWKIAISCGTKKNNNLKCWPEQRPISNAGIKALDSWWDFALLKVTVKTVFAVLAFLWGIGFVLDSPSRMSVCLTFISAVSEGPRAADGTWSFLQRGCAATQWVTLSIQVKGVLGGDTVGAAHAAAAWWQVILTDVGGAHCTEQNIYIYHVIFSRAFQSSIIHAGTKNLLITSC